MPREFSRNDRIADLIQKELATLIQREVRDPRVNMVTVNEVKLSRGFAHADVYVTMLPAENHVEGIAILNRAGGILRSLLAKALATRGTPQLRFHYDDTVEKGAKLSRIINQAIETDKANEAKRSHYATDAAISEKDNG